MLVLGTGELVQQLRRLTALTAGKVSFLASSLRVVHIYLQFQIQGCMPGGQTHITEDIRIVDLFKSLTEFCCDSIWAWSCFSWKAYFNLTCHGSIKILISSWFNSGGLDESRNSSTSFRFF